MRIVEIVISSSTEA